MGSRRVPLRVGPPEHIIDALKLSSSSYRTSLRHGEKNKRRETSRAIEDLCLKPPLSEIYSYFQELAQEFASFLPVGLATPVSAGESS